jgi:hypothetical protein
LYLYDRVLVVYLVHGGHDLAHDIVHTKPWPSQQTDLSSFPSFLLAVFDSQPLLLRGSSALQIAPKFRTPSRSKLAPFSATHRPWPICALRLKMTFTGRSVVASLTVLVAAIVLFAGNGVQATALTYKIDANERACFYAWVDKVGEKIAFYFAVNPPDAVAHTHPLSY